MERNNKRPRLVIDNAPAIQVVAGQSQPATPESEFDDRNPNRRAMLLVGGVEYSMSDSKPQ